MKKYITNCVNSTSELIEEMVDNSREIKYSTLLKHVSQKELDEIFPIYNGSGLTLEKDYSTSYYKSKYNGKPCVYVEHSRIEYIFQ